MDILGNVTSLLGAMPSATAIGQNLLLGAGTTVVMAGLTSGAGQNAIDPLHLIFKSSSGPSTVAPAVPTTTASAFSAMNAAAQTAFLNAGGHIVPG